MKSSMPKISVVTVNYNNKVGLEKTVQSVLSQDFNSKEFIVVDGASNDGSVAIIEEYRNHFAFACSEKDNGVFNAMNKGIEKATGDYVIFMNSGDVFYDAQSLGKLAAGAAEEPDFVYANVIFESANQRREVVFPDVLTFSYLYRKFLPHQATLTKLRLLQKRGGYDEQYKITADSAFIKREIALMGATYKHVSAFTAICELGGMSTDDERYGEQRRKEKNNFWEKNFKLFLEDYQRLFQLEKELTHQKPPSMFKRIAKKILGYK
jgi:glycosyltransferase involved in cell wall biosynthesis